MILRRKYNGAKHITEAADPAFIRGMVGERSIQDRSRTARTGGLDGRDYADMSNDKAGEKPARRKPKVS